MSLVNMYMYFRSHLLKKISEQERLVELVCDLKLEDKYPSFLLNEMKQLTDYKLSELNIQRLWLQKLPPQIRNLLLLSSDSLSSLSLLADNIKDLQCLPEVQLPKEAAHQYEQHEHGSDNSDDHSTENAQVINNVNSIQEEKKATCLDNFCKCV
ncbi:PREDICTED: uncharacterized protein LOC107173556 [Diuraphis noxia]|uniref:uncharacterized protein LOC107173556 n=1 Tax=Diuraphis noxia TaxID=143948 RepID=UPI0007635616|nr:PREDICTED: uncharacterized protein LOC107173556 [Diuraphis noxia]